MAFLKDTGSIQAPGRGNHTVGYLSDKVRDLEAALREKERLIEYLEKPRTGSKYGGNQELAVLQN